MTNPVKVLIVVLVAVALLVVLTACGGDKTTEPYQDAPRSGADNGAATVVTMPDGFNNVATKCIAGTGIRVAVIFHSDNNYGGVSMVADPTCKS